MSAPTIKQVGLAPSLQIWLNDLSLAQVSPDDEYPDDIDQRLLYLVRPLEGRNPQVCDLGVETISIRLQGDGSFASNSTNYNPATLDERGAGGTRFLRPSDREILPRLARLAQRGGSAGFAIRLAGAEGNMLLRAILATGRARWDQVVGAVLHEAEPLATGIVWALNPDGSQSPTLEVPEHCVVVRMSPPWCIDPHSGKAHAVRSGLADRVADTVLAAPPVPPEQADALRTRLARDLPAIVPQAAATIEPPEQLITSPVPVLYIEPRRKTLPHWVGAYRDPQGRTVSINVGRLIFRYDGFDIAARDDRAQPRYARGSRIIEIVRDQPAEAAALQTLIDLGFKSPSSGRGASTQADDLMLSDPNSDSPDAWLDFFYHDAPVLEAAGWIIERARDLPVRLIKGDATAVTAALNPGEDDAVGPAKGKGAGLSGAEFGAGGTDWFELDLGIIVDGERIDLLPALIDLISSNGWSPEQANEADPDEAASDEPFYLPLRDGRVFALPRARLLPILHAVYELLSTRDVGKSGKMRLTALDAGIIAGLETAIGAEAWSGGELLRRHARLLGANGGIPTAVIPPGFTADLRSYQAQGVDWLQFLREAGLAGILADEMGLGKTVQALAHILIEREAGRLNSPALIIAPTSLVVNWQREAERFAPALRVLVLHGPARADLFPSIPEHDLVITSYPLLARDHTVLHAQRWHMVVLDEAQIIKNPNALTSRMMRGLQAEHRICLTGTPLENNLGELWSLFSFLSPELLGDRKSFQKRWRTPIEKQGDNERQALLARFVRPFLLRRTKALVAAELPPKTEIVEQITMDAEQRDLYEAIRLAMHSKVREAIAEKGLARSHIVILEALLRLRQTCCDPRLLKMPAEQTKGAASAKLDRLAEMVPELVADGRRILIFSQFTSMLTLIEGMLRHAKLPWVKLTGDTRDRQAPITQFQTGTVPVFLISLKAGGVGLNLTAADTVIHYDPWWNPAVEDQATDRAHRIGQHNPVFVHRLVVADSVEEKMEALKLRKRQLAEGLFDNAAGESIAFSEADIEDLFA